MTINSKSIHNFISTIVGKLRRAKKYVSHRVKHMRHKTPIVTVLLIAMVAFAASRYFLPKPTTDATAQPISGGVQSTNVASKLPKGTPSYATLLPAGKSIESLGGWTRVSPENRTPVYTYIDKIQTTPINVSQQPLPADFKPEVDDQIAEFAKSYNANQKITVGTLHIYIGTSIKGIQSVIFTKNDLLILIKSTAIISDNDWAAYISTLQ